MEFTKILLSAAEQTSANSAGWIMPVYLVGIIALMYFLLIRPQKKKQKKEEAMRNNIQVGDDIITIGGIYGRVMAIKDDSIVIESLGDHSKQRIAKWAIQQNLTIHDDTAK